MTDPIESPRHYTEGKNIEPIQVIEDWKLGFHLGNAVKYICRAGLKDGSSEVEDLNKALWYIKRRLQVLTDYKEELWKPSVEQEEALAKILWPTPPKIKPYTPPYPYPLGPTPVPSDWWKPYPLYFGQTTTKDTTN